MQHWLANGFISTMARWSFAPRAALAVAALCIAGVHACDRETSELSGTRGGLSMAARQLRGYVTVVDACSFGLTGMEVEPGADAVWWAASGSTPEELEEGWLAAAADVVLDLSAGLPLADEDGSGFFDPDPSDFGDPDSFANVPAGVAYVELAAGVEWGTISTLALRELGNATDGVAEDASRDEVLLDRARNGRTLGFVVLQKIRPGAEQVLVDYPTLFDNCLQLSEDLRVRWSIVPAVGDAPSTIELGLEAPLRRGQYMGFGPATPGATNRRMGGADAAVMGYKLSAEDEPFLLDVKMTSYATCNYGAAQSELAGVCEDSSLAGGAEGVDNLDLVYAHRQSGITFVRWSRALDTGDAVYDYPLTPGTPQDFVWAVGSSSPSSGGGVGDVAPWKGPALNYHGPNPETDAHEVEGVDVGATGYRTCGVPKPAPTQEQIADSVVRVDSDGFDGRFDKSTMLSGGSAQLFWTVDEGRGEIRLGARFLNPANWVSIAFGERMIGSHAYVGYFNQEQGVLRVDTYDMTDITADGVRPISAPLSVANAVLRNDGGMSLEVWRPLDMSDGRPPLDPGSDQPIVWAYGDTWEYEPVAANEHVDRSARPTIINLKTGSASEGGADARLLIHSWLMGVSWGVLIPGAVLAARFLRNNGAKLVILQELVTRGAGTWFKIHSNLVMTASVATLIGGILSLWEAEEHGSRHLQSTHADIGVATLVLLVAQFVIAQIRPPGAPPKPLKRVVWEYTHRILAAAAGGSAIACLVTGVIELERHGAGDTDRQLIVVLVWLGFVVLSFVTLECASRRVAKAEPLVKADSAQSSNGAQSLELSNIHSEEDAGAADGADAEPGATEDSSTETGQLSSSQGTALPSAKSGMPQLCGSTLLLLAAGLAVVMLPLILWAYGIIGGSTGIAAPMPVGGSDGEGSVALRPNVPISGPRDGWYARIVEDNTNGACRAFPVAHVGDGWCDDFAPFNTAACSWDGGDCCNVTAPLFDCKDPDSSHYGEAAPKGASWPVPRNPRYKVPNRPITGQSFHGSYTNYYEFSGGKRDNEVRIAEGQPEYFDPDTWEITIGGLVAEEITITAQELIDLFGIEERVYRHRCVEAWSVVVPWAGFPMAKLIEWVKPDAEAQYVQFTTWDNADVRTGAARWPWPYVEGLTLEEAAGEMAFFGVGAYQDDLFAVNGGPIRAVLPYKYGFKSAKAIRRIDFVVDRPVTFWDGVSVEYGFFANVNPSRPHRRWSQARETAFSTDAGGNTVSERIDTLLYNGYEARVSYLYEELADEEDVFF